MRKRLCKDPESAGINRNQAESVEIFKRGSALRAAMIPRPSSLMPESSRALSRYRPSPRAGETGPRLRLVRTRNVRR